MDESSWCDAWLLGLASSCQGVVTGSGDETVIWIVDDDKNNAGNVEKKPPAAFSPFCRAHVLEVGSARQSGCGLAG